MSLTRRPALLALFAASLVVLPVAAQWQPVDRLDPDLVYRIKDQGLQRSKVMELAAYLTDVYGPRLTGSPDFGDGADWAQKTMRILKTAGIRPSGRLAAVELSPSRGRTSS